MKKEDKSDAEYFSANSIYERMLSDQAAYAITKLKKYREDYKRGVISRDVVKLVAKAHIEVYDKYTKLVAKKHKVPFKKFSLSAFLR